MERQAHWLVFYLYVNSVSNRFTIYVNGLYYFL